MNATLFIDYVKKWFGPLVAKVTETINGEKTPPKYLHEAMLTPEYSADLRWDSTSINGSIVAADIVAMDSPLPLKRRDSLAKASGDLPKLGIKLKKGEKLISDINVMRARGASDLQIVQKLFDDMPKSIDAVRERLEAIFLLGLSTGVGLVPSEQSAQGVRIDYGYLPQNKLLASTKWGEAGYTPMTDTAKVFEKATADGNTITTIMLSRAAFNKMRNSDEGKRLAASYAGTVIVATADLPVPTPGNFQSAYKDEYGADLQIVDRTVYIEGANGKRTPIKPFDENALVFLTTTNVGRKLYGTLAEETNPVAGVEYQKALGFILVSKYSKNDPLEEYTSSQALAVPVIDGVDAIYLLNTQGAELEEA